MTRTPPIIFETRIMTGTGIKDAANALCLVADKLGVIVSADFNGCILTAGPGADTQPGDLIRQWDAHQQASSRSAWSTPRYPGDAVRVQRFLRKVRGRVGEDFGDIRIQHYGEGGIRVATFLPGRLVESEGDTPKTEPDRSQYVTTQAAADAVFDAYVAEAKADGWRLA